MISTPKPYLFTVIPVPAPEGATTEEWKPQFVMFELTYKGKVILKGTVGTHQLATTVQAEVNKTVSNHQLQVRYNRSLAGIWNNYPVDWLWYLLYRLGFKYCAGGRSSTHLIHFFARSYFDYGVLVRWKGKANGASWPRVFIAPPVEMMQGIEEGRYE